MSLFENLRARSPACARKRHCRRRELRPRPRGPDPALGRRGRPADAGLHRRRRQPGAARRRDLLHLAARHPRTARRRSPATTPGISASEFRGGGIHRDRRRHAGDPARAAGDGGRGRRGASTCRPAWPNFPGAAGVAGATPVPVRLDQRGQWLDLRRRQARGGGDAAHHARSSSTRRPIRPAGPPISTTLQAILDLARRKNLWIIADEIYALFHYGGDSARRPSWTSWTTRTASCSSTPSPRTGR